ncbi:hypothetical protein Gotur_015104 [Gossypium turneri]
MCSIVLLQSMILMLQILCKPFLVILNSYLMSKSTSSSLVESSNVSNNDLVYSSLHQLNVNKAYLG